MPPYPRGAPLTLEPSLPDNSARENRARDKDVPDRRKFLPLPLGNGAFVVFLHPPGYPSPVILITGGAGFIGSHLADAVGPCRVLDDLSTGRRENLHARAELLEGSVADPAVCARAVAGVDLVYHLAAITSVPASVERPLDVYRVNVEGTVNLLAAAARAGVKRVVLAGSTAVYGDAPVPVAEDAPADPLSPYGASKLAAELFLRAFGKSVALDGVALRLFNVYGPRQRADSPYSGVISIFRDRIGRGDPVEIFGDGLQTRDFIHVGDVVRAFRLAATAPPGVYNVGTGTETSVLDLAAAVGAAIGRTPKIRHRPERPGDIRRSAADTMRAKRELGFEATAGLRLY